LNATTSSNNLNKLDTVKDKHKK